MQAKVTQIGNVTNGDTSAQDDEGLLTDSKSRNANLTTQSS